MSDSVIISKRVVAVFDESRKIVTIVGEKILKIELPYTIYTEDGKPKLFAAEFEALNSIGRKRIAKILKSSALTTFGPFKLDGWKITSRGSETKGAVIMIRVDHDLGDGDGAGGGGSGG